MLRGAQTPGELKQRGERLHPFASLEDVDDVLSTLAERDLVARVPRRPGQKEDRFAQLLGEGPNPAGEPAGATAGGAASAPERLQRVWPYLLYEDVDAAVAWLGRAFGFREVERSTGAAGGTHVELELPAGGGVYLGQPPGGAKRAGADACVFVLVDAVEAHHARAVATGAEIVEPLNDSPTGHRRYGVADPQGHRWFFATPLG